MSKIDELYKYLPVNGHIDFELINNEIFNPYVSILKNTMQEPKWHGEGDVYTHTTMVLNELIDLCEYKELTEIEKLIVFLSALFHDIGKGVCTKVVNGEITSLNHGVKGSIMLREYLWKDLGLAGTKEYQEFRESICLLVRYHSNPIHVYEDLTKRVIKLSTNTKLAKFFNIKLLCILSKADALGRISSSDDEHLFNISQMIKEAKKLDCFEKCFEFSDSYTKYQYLTKDNIWPYQSLYNTNLGTIILLCGLPGTGKDTFIKENYPDLEVISLDDVRDTLNIDPSENQNEVYEYAKNKAKDLLRNKKEFIWNATNLTNLVRNKQLNLFHNYKFSVKIIFLETSLDENLKRNKNRVKQVPEKVIYKLLSNINIPEAFEAEDVEWICL